MLTYKLSNPKKLSIVISWFLLIWIIFTLSSHPPLNIALFATVAVLAIPLFLTLLQLGSYANIHDNTLTLVYGFIFKTTFSIQSIQKIYIRKTFKFGQTSALVIDYTAPGTTKSIYATGIFTDDAVREKLKTDLIHLNPRIKTNQS